MLSFESETVGGYGTDNVAMTTTNGRASLTLSGELDVAMVPRVRSRLAGFAGDVELDCAGLTFIDSAGINLFVELHHDLAGAGAKLTLVNPPHCVARLLELTAVDRLVEVRSEATGA
jgi:anti-anti-sigma factor